MKQSAADKLREANYRAEDDHRTLERAEEVRSDPERMRGVKRHHTKKVAEIQRVGARLGMADAGRKMPKRRVTMARASRGR